MNDFTRPPEPHHDFPGVASFYPPQGRFRTSIDSRAMAVVGNIFWAAALLTGAAALLTVDTRVARGVMAFLEIPSMATLDLQTWLHLALLAGAAFIVGRIIHSINKH